MSKIIVDEIAASTPNSSLTIKASGSGVVKLGDGELKFPDADGTSGHFIKTDGSAQLSFAEAGGGGFTLGTEQSTTSGTAKTFTGIPSGTTQIVITLADVELSGSADLDITIGDSGGLETSGYKSGSVLSQGTTTALGVLSTTSFIMYRREGGTAYNGTMTLSLKDSVNNDWVSSHSACSDNATRGLTGGGTKSLSGELTQVQITGGSFILGSVNILYQ